MSETILERYIRDVIYHIRETLPQFLKYHNISKVELTQIVRNGISKAKYYGIDNQCDVMRFIECTIIIDRNFDDNDNYPWAREILCNGDLDVVDKIEEISGHVLLNWEEPPIE